MATTDTKVLFVRGAFDINPQLSDGLYLRVGGGVLLDGTGYRGIQGAHLLLTASVTNYIEVSAVGVVSSNVTGFTPGAAPLYEVKMGATTITSCNDWRNADVALGGSAVAIRTEAAALAVNDLVYISGWNETHGLPLVTKADADASGRQAQFVMRAALAQNANGMGFTAFRTAADLDTQTGTAAVGDPIYLSTTAGGWTPTAPTGAAAAVQIVGRVAVRSLGAGVIEFDLRDFPTVGTNDIQPKAVTGPKITDAAFGLQGVTAVVVDHADASPKQILAADASNDRVALVYVVATEAAAGEPDVDIGTTNTINSVVDDFKAGAWVVGDRVFNLVRIPAGENVRATIAVAGTAGAFDVYVHVLTPALKRAQLAEDALAVYGIPAHALKSNAGAALLAAETADTFNVAVAANVISVQGEITDNENESSVGYFQFVLPPEYVAGGDVQLRIKTALTKTGDAVDNGSTIDAEAYEQTGNGAVGADLCATAAQSWAAVDTWYTKTFTITATDLVAGDIVNFKLTTSVIDSEAGAGTLRANLDGIALLLDVKG